MVRTYWRVHCRGSSHSAIQAYSLVSNGQTSISASLPQVPEKKSKYRETILDSCSDNQAAATSGNADKSKLANQFLFYNKDKSPYMFSVLQLPLEP